MEVAIPESRGWARWVFGISASVVVVGCLAGIMAATRTPSGSTVARVRLDQIPQGLTPMAVDGRAAVVQREGDDLIVFAGAPPPQWDMLGWCANAHVFVATPSGSTYDERGRKRGGPSPRSLDRFASHLDGDTVVIDTAVVEYRDVTGNPMTSPAPQPSRQLLAFTPEWAASFRSVPSWCPQA